MPAKTPANPDAVTAKLGALGQQIRDCRKKLRVSATTAAQAASMSRVTLHRIETGEASVTIGAYMNVLAALGLEFAILTPTDDTKEPEHDTRNWIPARVRLADYPQLKRLAWQVHGTDELTPTEALGIYERNWRHLDLQAMEPRERDLLDALRRALGEGPVGV
jgi:transcriptional regulator with XRE-family HTH domain